MVRNKVETYPLYREGRGWAGNGCEFQEGSNKGGMQVNAFMTISSRKFVRKNGGKKFRAVWRRGCAVPRPVGGGECLGYNFRARQELFFFTAARVTSAAYLTFFINGPPFCAAAAVCQAFEPAACEMRGASEI